MLLSYDQGDVVLLNKWSKEYKRFDVLYLEYPLLDSNEKKTFFIQRLVALPGDTLQLINKSLYINGVLQEEKFDLLYNYFIKTKQIQLDSVFESNYGLQEGGRVSDEFDYSYSLSKKQKEELLRDSVIKSVELKTEKANMFDETCFPGSIHCSWNGDHYGKIVLPKKNTNISLDTTNISLYKNIIVDYEGNLLEIKNDSLYINGILCKSYEVKQNYYFVLGDNRDNANDSRTWGFLPETSILAKVIYKIKSK